MPELLEDIFAEYRAIAGDEEVGKPELINFCNTGEAVKMLNKHLADTLPIAVHCDVDCDGIGSGYIAYRFLTAMGVAHKSAFIINGEKEHGISQKHVDYFSNNNIGLLIILDSSSNEIDYIKQMNCDVLVIDHHVILHDQLSGYTAGGEYVVVSNMVDNTESTEINNLIKTNNPLSPNYLGEFIKDANMSAGLVVYEFLRVYQEAYKIQNLVEDMMLYQWVGITLLTDAIPTGNKRNQWYMEKTVHNRDMEVGIKQLVTATNRFNMSLDKSFVNFTLAPMINKAIRAGASAEAMNIIFNHPSDIRTLDKYKEQQAIALQDVMEGAHIGTDYVSRDITGTGISRSYCGVMATKLCDLTSKNAVVYVQLQNGLLSGSFRGRQSKTDYRGFFEKIDPTIYAQGHDPAFGFRAEPDKLAEILHKIAQAESEESTQFYMTAGYIPEGYRGINHIEDMNEFKREGKLWRLGIANSKLSSYESINIMVLNQGYTPVETKGKVFFYDVLGLRCMAFEQLTTKWLSIYVEYSRDIKIYIKNYH